MARRNPIKRQVRGFVMAWIGITTIVAAATFFAIYLTYGTPAEAQTIAALSVESAGTLPAVFGTAPATAIPPTATPTDEPTATETPTDEPVAAQAAEAEEAETEAEDEGVQVAAVNSSRAAAEEDAAADEETDDEAASEEEAPAGEPTVPPAESDDFEVGIQVQHSLDMNQQNMDGFMRDVAQKMNLPWIKFQVRWEDFEAVEDDYKWAPLRLVIRSAKQFGTKVMVSVVTAPEWSREPGANLEQHGPPADNEDYVEFLTEMLTRFEGDIHAVEVWNEQNLDREWTSSGGLDANAYVDLLGDSYAAIKEIDPGIIVISGALAPTGGGVDAETGIAYAIDDYTYLDAMIDAGLLEVTDCVGAHHNGYNISPSEVWDSVTNDPDALFRGPFDNPHHSWSFRSTLEEYASKISAAGSDIKLCVTEFGWASTEDLPAYPAGFDFAADNTLQEQAEWTIEAIENMQEWEFVRLAFIWNFNYAPQAGWDTNNDNVPYSFIGPDWVHRPVFDAVIEWGTEEYGAQ